MTKPEHTDQQDGRIRPPVPGSDREGPQTHDALRWGARRPKAMRLLLLTLSVGGTLAALVLWFGGHGGVAARVLAGDVVLIVAALLLL